MLPSSALTEVDKALSRSRPHTRTAQFLNCEMLLCGIGKHRESEGGVERQNLKHAIMFYTAGFSD